MKTAVLLDFDDTIFDTLKYIRLRDEFYETNFDGEFKKRFWGYVDRYANGEIAMFDIHDVLTDDEINVTRNHLNEVAPQLVHLDFQNFIAKLDKSRFSPIILTFGEQKWQLTKITKAGVDLPVICTDVKNKTDLLKKWQQGDYYKINDEIFNSIISVDDKLKNFAGFDELANARGFLMRRKKIEMTASENLPSNVTIVDDFNSVKL